MPRLTAGVIPSLLVRDLAETMPYGMCELGLRDPNGYCLTFTQPVVPT